MDLDAAGAGDVVLFFSVDAFADDLGGGCFLLPDAADDGALPVTGFVFDALAFRSLSEDMCARVPRCSRSRIYDLRRRPRRRPLFKLL